MIELAFQLKRRDGERTFALQVARADSADGDHPLRMEQPVTAVFGPSGAGKSTLLGCISGTVRDATGRLVIRDEVVVDTVAGVNPPPERRRIGLVFQNGRLFPHLTVERNLDYGWRRLARDQRETVNRDAIIQMLGLPPLLTRKPGSLSGGEQQRVAIARSLLAAPRLLLLDEPVAALDHQSRDAALSTIRATASATGVPVLLVTHDPLVVRALASDVVVMDGGRVIAQGDPYAVLDHPRSLGVASLAGLANVFDEARVTDASDAKLMIAIAPDVELAATPLPGLSAGQAVGVGIAAHDIILATGDLAAARLSTRNVIAGRISALPEPAGGRVLATVDAGGCVFRVALVSATVSELALAVGTPVTLLIKATAIHVMPRPRPHAAP